MGSAPSAAIWRSHSRIGMRGLWGLHSVAADFPAGAHGVVGGPVVTGAVAVTVDRFAKALPVVHRYLPVKLAAHADFINFEQGAVGAGRSDFAGVELVVRVEGGFDALQLRVEFTEELRRIFTAHALAVFAPEQAAVFVGEGGHFITDGANLFSLRWVF